MVVVGTRAAVAACYVVSTVLDIPDIAPERVRRISRAEYEGMVAAGMFGPDERVELLDGVLVEMSPQDIAHAWAIEALTERLVTALRGRARLRCQLPLAVSEYSVPEPDFAVVPISVPRTEVPTTAHLVVEVANTSLRKDRGLKARLYAAAGVQDYWVVDARARVVHVHAGSGGDGYERVAKHSAGVIGLRDSRDVTVAIESLWVD